MEKIAVLFLGIEGFEAFSLASLPVLQSESVCRILIQSHFNSAREECAP